MFKSTELICSYMRMDAIADGQRIEIPTGMLRKAGILLPSVVSIDLWAALEPSEAEQQTGQSYEGRLWDVLVVFRQLAKQNVQSRMELTVLVATEFGAEEQSVVVVLGPDDEGRPCLTFMTSGCE